MDDERLQQFPLFAGLRKRERKRLAPLVEDIEVAEGRELAHEGDVAHEFFVIEEGTATVSQQGSTIAELGPGDFFGEMALHNEERRRTSTVVASSPMRLAVILGHDVRFIERELPGVASEIRTAMDARRARDEQR